MTYPWDDDPTPTEATRRTWGWVPFGLNAVAASAIIIGAACFAIAGIVYALIPASTAIQVKQAQQQGTVNSAQYSATVRAMSYQVPLLAEMEQHVTNITGPGGLASTRSSLPASSPEQLTVRAQELNEITSLCSEGINLDPGVAPGSVQMEAVYNANCIAGTPIAAPQLANPVPAGGQ